MVKKAWYTWYRSILGIYTKKNYDWSQYTGFMVYQAFSKTAIRANGARFSLVEMFSKIYTKKEWK